MYTDDDFPECFASSCTEDDIDEYAANFLASLTDAQESWLSGEDTFSSAQCYAVGYDGTATNPNQNPSPTETTTPPPILVDASEQCIDETNALRNTTEYESARDAFVDDVNNDKACSTDASTNTVTCVYDSKTYPSHNLFFSACSQLGGETHLISDSVTCSFVDIGTNWVSNYYYVDKPECVSPACDADVAEALVEASTDRQAEHAEDQLSAQYDNVQCTSPAPPLDTSASPSPAPLIPTTGPPIVATTGSPIVATTGPPIVATTPKPVGATTSKFSLPPIDDPSGSNGRVDPTSLASGLHTGAPLGIISAVLTLKCFNF